MFPAVVVATVLLCGIVSGFLFALAVVAMPGLSAFGDREFIRSFQLMDGVIQRNQPVFMLVWVGSVIAALVTVGAAVAELDGAPRAVAVSATVVYLLGVQLPTMAINIPANNRIQRVDAIDATNEELAQARAAFEQRWNLWNGIRTALAITATLLFLIALAQS